MKLAILYICTGKYSVFWKDFYLSCEENFLLDVEKHYFVFTDNSVIDFEEVNSRIHKIYQENLGWPGNTLRRYEVFLKHKEQFKDFDYLVFLNANLLIMQKVSSNDFLPQGKENLIACLHPGYFNKKISKFTYERRASSLATILPNEGKYYFAGGINGGRAIAFIEAMEVMDARIKADSARGVVAVWHDESHWNRYLVGREDVKILPPAYLYPEGWNLPYEKIMLVRDKKMLGGHALLRGKLELRLVINNFKTAILNLVAGIKPAKVIKINGGLGNQLFQYARGRSLELSGRKVIFDTSFFDGNKAVRDMAREYKLGNFKIQTQAVFDSQKHLVREMFFAIDKIKNKLGGLVGYFENYQDQKFFIEIEGDIRREFVSKNKLSSEAQGYLDKIKQCSSVSLHVRRGDYVTSDKTNQFHGSCDLGYYQEAVAYIKSKISEPVFFIFSDDVEWVKANLIFEAKKIFIIGETIKDYEELMLMSQCQHNIIANSTFSWWGAWLNQNLEKIVIAPKKWFANKKLEKINPAPETWIRL